MSTSGREGRSEGRPHWGRAAVVAGLLAVAVTQPVLDLLGRNPTFFVAGGYTTTQIVVFGVVVAIVPSVVAALLLVVSGRLHPTLGRGVFGLLVVASGALLGNVVVRGLGGDGWVAAGVATVLGAGGAFLLTRRRAPRLLLQYLAAANVLFLVFFVLFSPASELRSAGAGAQEGAFMPTPPGPVVVIVFDELPLATLLREDGTLNADRYPAFAALGERTTWYRNTASAHAETDKAVPSLMTGLLPTDALPTYQEHPRNVLSLLGQAMPVERYEPVTDLCPPEVCEERRTGSLTTALADAGVVYGHRLLPEGLRSALPSIDSTWGSFGDDVGGDEPAEPEPRGIWSDSRYERWRSLGAAEQSPAGQAAVLVDQIREVDAEPSLHFVHVVLPHRPWKLTPWGTTIVGESPQFVELPLDFPAEWIRRMRYQMHSLQVGAADAALGDVIATLDDAGLWEDTTLVVTADHGYSLLPPDWGRQPTEANAEELYRVPLFIKAAGQTGGSLVDDPAQVIDVLPTLVDLLDITTAWEFDGHSLLDGSAPTAERTVGPGIDGLLSLARQHAADFPLGDDWTGLAATGVHGALVGQDVEDLAVGAPSSIQWEVDQADTLAALPTARGEVPHLLTGTVQLRDGEPRPKLAVVVNGTVAGMVDGYLPREGGGWQFATYLAPLFRDGANEVTGYVVEETPTGPVLHPID